MGNMYQIYYKIYQMAVKCFNGHKIYQHFAFRDPQKYTQIGIFGLKIYDLATLPEVTKRSGKNAFILQRLCSVKLDCWRRQETYMHAVALAVWHSGHRIRLRSIS
jgi:hypothetical protein